MERYPDIVEVLDTVSSGIDEISKAYDFARQDEEIHSILRTKVGHCFEDLRRCLEYSAQDIWASYSKKKNKVYFPYGKTDEIFQKSVKKNLPALREQAPNLYALIESIQPFISGSDWLLELCGHTNFNKHDRLSPQVRRNSPSSSTTFGNIAKVESGGTIILDGANWGGVPMSKNGKLTISRDRTVAEMRAEISIPVPLVREFDWVKFEIDGSLHDILDLIKNSHARISSYISQLNEMI